MSSRALRLPVLGLAFFFTVTDAAGQRSCDLIDSELFNLRQTNDARISYVSAPRFECDDGTRIEADSSVTFEATSFTQLFGNVVFRDPERELHSDRAQYFDRVGRLQAQGSVRLTNLADGSWVTGEDLVLLQESDDRVEEEVTVRQGRPHAHLVPRVIPDSLAVGDSIRAPEPENTETLEPYEVDADLIHLVGDRLFQARGRVEITNESLQSYGDSVEFQQDVGLLTLFENARVISEDTASRDTLDLRGDTITMSVPDDQIDEMESRGRAQLLANDVDMRGPVIRLAFEDEELERVFAVQREGEQQQPPQPPPEQQQQPPPPQQGQQQQDHGPAASGEDLSASSTVSTQPLALAEDFRLTGDSIEAVLVEGELDEVIATGAARGVSTARDSLNTEETDELFRDDWIEGDTIIATFRPVPVARENPGGPGSDGLEAAAAEATERQLDLLVARGDAKSFYRAAPDSAAAEAAEPCPPELNYVLGDEVRLFMKDGEVERMEVDNPTGVNLVSRCPGSPPAASPESQATPGLPGADDAPPVVDSVPPGPNSLPPVGDSLPPVGGDPPSGADSRAPVGDGRLLGRNRTPQGGNGGNR